MNSILLVSLTCVSNDGAGLVMSCSTVGSCEAYVGHSRNPITEMLSTDNLCHRQLHVSGLRLTHRREEERGAALQWCVI